MTRLRTPGWIVALGFLTVAGCGSDQTTPQPPAQPFKGVAIVAATLGDAAALPGLTALRGEWAASQGAQVTVREEPIDARSTAGADVLVFRGDHLGALVDANALVPLPDSLTRPPAPVEDPNAPGAPAEKSAEPPPDPVKFSDIVPAYRDQVVKYGGVRMAFPYGGSALVLVFQRSAFDREANKAAAKEAKVALEPPKTWEELDVLAKFFQGRDWSGDGRARSGIALALGPDAEGVGDATFLARAAGLGQHRDQYSFLFDADTMAPRIDSPPFVETLEALVALKDAGPEGHGSFDVAAARKAFAEGRAAMLIDRAERVGSWGEGKSIGVAPLPGSARMYDPAGKRFDAASPLNRPSYLPLGGGWLVGVSSAAQGPKREAAIDFARYLITPAAAARARADRSAPMLAVRSALLASGPPDASAGSGVDPRQWSDAVSRTIQAERVIPGLRIPEAEGYLADLSKGRVAAMKGEPAAAALQAVARAWSERTARLGAARQLWHYRRSLNSLATSAEPPAR